LRADEVSLLPFPKPSNNLVSRRFDGKISDFTRENDFQALLPDENDIDINDPVNDHLVYLFSKRSVYSDSNVFQLQNSDFASVFGNEGFCFSNFVKFKESLRMKLLRLRNIKPFLFNDPIPLSENVIKSSELYKNILFTEQQSYEENYEISNNISNQSKVTNFLLRIRHSQTAQNSGRKKKRLTTASVVIETDYLAPAEAEDFNIFIERKHGYCCYNLSSYCFPVIFF
jgi:hypothetical protein